MLRWLLDGVGATTSPTCAAQFDQRLGLVVRFLVAGRPSAGRSEVEASATSSNGSPGNAVSADHACGTFRGECPLRGLDFATSRRRGWSGMAVGWALNGLGGSAHVFRAQVELRASVGDRRRRRPRRPGRRWSADLPQVRLDASGNWRSISTCRRTSSTCRGEDGELLTERDPARSRGAIRRRRGGGVDRLLHQARRRAEAPLRGREGGGDFVARHPFRHHDRAGASTTTPTTRTRTTSSPMPPARRIASRRWRRCCTTASRSSRAS